MSELVSRWFGPQFDQLHPLLQQLHRSGGVLSGPVDIVVGRGVAGWLGRLLLRRLGVVPASSHHLEVKIRQEGEQLYWQRRIDGQTPVLSRFQPHGQWPDGWWTEQTGWLTLQLTVDVIDGGWYWRLQKIRYAGVPLPLSLFPKTQAYKRVENNQYRFSVEFSLPLFGLMLSYSGLMKFNQGDGSSAQSHTKSR